MILLTTPLQSAGEEVGFRGYLTQAVASWSRRPLVGTVVAAAVTSVLFALAHGVQDPALFLDRLAFGVTASWLAWRTGGLEAPVALHVVNNLVALLFSASTGQLEDSITGSTLPWSVAALDVATMVVYAALVHRLADRRSVEVERVAAPRRRFVRSGRGRLSWSAPACPAASGGRQPMGYGVIGSPTDSGSVSLGSSPGTPAQCSTTAQKHGPIGPCRGCSIESPRRTGRGPVV